MGPMLKTIGLGIWAVVVVLIAGYMAATWNTGATVDVVRAESKPSGLEVRHPDAITVPMISDGKLRGYVVAKISFTTDAAALAGFAHRPAAFRRRRGLPPHLHRRQGRVRPSVQVQPRQDHRRHQGRGQQAPRHRPDQGYPGRGTELRRQRAAQEGADRPEVSRDRRRPAQEARRARPGRLTTAPASSLRPATA